MRRATSAGISLTELLIVLVLLGMVLGVVTPAFGRFFDDVALHGATERITSTLLRTRSHAAATRTSETMLFHAGQAGTDYRLVIGGVTKSGWTLPNRITYAWLSGTVDSVVYTPDGRCSASGLILLQTSRGKRDTVSVLSSGLVLTQ
jgi:type II secretory pathway pseudopilin PulG